MGQTGFAILDNVDHKHGHHRLDVVAPWPDALPSRLFDGSAPTGAVAAVAASYGGGRKKPWLALATVRHTGALVLHRDALAALRRTLPVASTPIRFVRTKGKPPEDGYELVCVEPLVPLDRVASDLVMLDGPPLTGVVREINALRFSSPDVLPPLFRLADAPHLLVVREDALAALAEATGGDLRARPAGNDLRFPPQNLPSEPLAIDEGVARAAYDALWRLARGAAQPRDREAALAHPIVAIGVASLIDGGPRDDTRAAASRSPHGAAMYALHVDRGPRDDTRAAARRDPFAGYEYAWEVDLAGDDDLVALMRRRPDWWQEVHLRGTVEELEARRRTYRGAAARPATRERAAGVASPAVDAAVFREEPDATRAVAPLSAELRADVVEMTARGYQLLGLDPATDAGEVVDVLHATIAAIQTGERELPAGKAAGTQRLALACVLADALCRGLGWSWASVGEAGRAAVVSPTGTHGVVPLTPIARLAKKGAGENTIKLMFNMLVAGSVPPAAPGEVVLLG